MRIHLLLAVIFSFTIYNCSFAQEETKEVEIKVGAFVKNNYESLKINPCWHCDQHKCENCPVSLTGNWQEYEINLSEVEGNTLKYTFPVDAEVKIEMFGTEDAESFVPIGEMQDNTIKLKQIHHGRTGFTRIAPSDF